LDLATDELGDLEGRSIVVVGAGKVGSLVCSALGRTRASRITVANRSADRARKIAVEIGAETAALDQLPTLLENANVVITATTSDEPTIDEATVRQSLAERANTMGPLLIIDLAIPRDVDPAVAELEGIRLLTLDDVKSRLDRHMSLRLGEVGPAEAVVDNVVDTHLHSPESTEVEALITQLRRTTERIRDYEVGRWLGSIDGAVNQEDVDRLTRSIVNKLFHTPMLRLRGAEELNGRHTELLSAVSELFDLSDSGEPTPPE
jgi:glutamyl-tRNA reductase